MAVYLITYDLNKSGQDYENVIDQIKKASTGSWCSYWKSSYLIKSNLTPEQIIENLKPYIDGNDRFLIIEVVNNKSGWLTEKQWNYINQNIF